MPWRTPTQSTTRWPRRPRAPWFLSTRDEGFLASKQCSDDVDENDLHDGHAGKDHRVADIRPIGRRELVRVRENRRIAARARDDARHFVVGHPKDRKAE